MPYGDNDLFLQEEIMLLALREQKGTVISGPSYSFAMAGAILAELTMAGRISVEEGRKKLVNMTARQPIGEPVIDECLAKIKAAKRRASLQTWVNRIANLKRLKHRVAEGLCKRGILRADEGRVLLIFSRKIFPERDPRPERKLIERLRKAIFTEARDIEPKTAVLVSLLSAADILKIPFEKKELRSRKKRIETISKGDAMGQATREAVQAAQTAAALAVVIPAMTVATISS